MAPLVIASGGIVALLALCLWLLSRVTHKALAGTDRVQCGICDREGTLATFYVIDGIHPICPDCMGSGKYNCQWH